MIQIEPCQAAHVEPLAGMLARAFRQDPLYEYVFPAEAAREALTAWDMGGILRYGLRFGEVLTTPQLDGCAVWLPPGETDFTEERMAQAGMLDAAKHIGEQAEKRLDLFVAASEIVHRRLLPGAHWYLVLLGVEPQCQAQGIGNALLARNLARADESGYPVYLETLKPGNLLYYQKRGFVVRMEQAFDRGGPTVWYMVREPQT